VLTNELLVASDESVPIAIQIRLMFFGKLGRRVDTRWAAMRAR
jgi:hypothetical protein